MVQVVSASGTVTRPADTTQYAAGDLVANSTTAGSVTPVTLSFAQSGKPVWLRRLALTHSKVTVTLSSFRVWLLNASPTVTNGDNGAIAGTFLSTVIAVVDVDVDVLLTGGGAWGSSLFDEGLILLPDTTYALIEATAAYTPASAEVFTLTALGTPYAL